MSVFREIEISYQGKAYTFTPSNKLLRRIERDVPLAGMVMRIQDEKPAVSEIAFVATEFLKAAGCEDVDEDAMYAAIMGDIAVDGEIFATMVNCIMQAISPTQDVAKNSSASQAGGKAAKARSRTTPKA